MCDCCWWWNQWKWKWIQNQDWAFCVPNTHTNYFLDIYFFFFSFFCCCCDKWLNRREKSLRKEENRKMLNSSSSGKKLFKLSFMCNVSTIYQDFLLLFLLYFVFVLYIEWDYLMMLIWMHKSSEILYLGKNWKEVKEENTQMHGKWIRNYHHLCDYRIMASLSLLTWKMWKMCGWVES